MKRLPLLALLLLNSFYIIAQRYEIAKQRSGLFISHKVTPKETLYSLGRMYHLSPKDIAAANGLKIDAGLVIGQEIKIPLKKDNFIQVTVKSKKGLQPVYHTVEKGDNLFKISKNYNHVKEAQLKKWNKLSKNAVKAGQELIVGYVKVSPNSIITDEKKETAAANSKPATKDAATAVTPEQIKRETGPSPGKPVVAPDVTPNSSEKKESAAEDNPVITPVSNTTPGESYFAANYSVTAANAREKKINGTAATFKSTSGWSDGKYYVLISEIAPETIVKITVNGRSVYAKVLEALPDLKDNKNITCRLSNAAASALGVTDAKFDVEIAYYE